MSQISNLLLSNCQQITLQFGTINELSTNVSMFTIITNLDWMLGTAHIQMLELRGILAMGHNPPYGQGPWSYLAQCDCIDCTKLGPPLAVDWSSPQHHPHATSLMSLRTLC